MASEVDSEFQSTYETRNEESDNFFDFSEEEPNSKPGHKRHATHYPLSVPLCQCHLTLGLCHSKRKLVSKVACLVAKWHNNTPTQYSFRLEGVLSESDRRDIECQTDSGTCEVVLSMLLELCPSVPLEMSLPSAEVGWRVARCYIHSVGHMKQSGINQGHISEATRKGIAFAEAAIRLDNDSWVSHKWYAICCGTLSQSESTQEKVS